MTETDAAREYFKPLTYEDISESDFLFLMAILQKHIEIRNVQELENYENTGQRDYIYSLEKHIYKPARKGVKQAFLKVKCNNYSVREAISFNPDGFIGFAGWASSYNVCLFTNAFKEWVDWIKHGRNLK